MTTCRCGAHSVCLCKAGTGIAEGEEPDQRRVSASRCFCPLCALFEMMRCRSGTALGNVLWEENQTLGGPVASSAVGTLPETGTVLPRPRAHSLCSQNPQDMSLKKCACSSHACPQWVVSLPSALIKSKLRMTRPRKPLSPFPWDFLHLLRATLQAQSGEFCMCCPGFADSYFSSLLR